MSLKLMKDGNAARDELLSLPDADAQQRGGVTADGVMSESVTMRDRQAVAWLSFEMQSRLTVEAIGMGPGLRPLDAPLPPQEIPHP